MKRKIKRIMYSVLMLTFVLALAGCGEKNKEIKEYTINADQDFLLWDLGCSPDDIEKQAGTKPEVTEKSSFTLYSYDGVMVNGHEANVTLKVEGGKLVVGVASFEVEDGIGLYEELFSELTNLYGAPYVMAVKSNANWSVDGIIISLTVSESKTKVLYGVQYP